MAQRRRAVGTFASGLFCRMTLLLPSLAGQPEEGQAVPAGAGDGHGNRTERRVMPVLKPEPIRQNLDPTGPPLPLPAVQAARQKRQAEYLLSADHDDAETGTQPLDPRPEGSAPPTAG